MIYGYKESEVLSVAILFPRSIICEFALMSQIYAPTSVIILPHKSVNSVLIWQYAERQSCREKAFSDSILAFVSRNWTLTLGHFAGFLSVYGKVFEAYHWLPMIGWHNPNNAFIGDQGPEAREPESAVHLQAYGQNIVVDFTFLVLIFCLYQNVLREQKSVG